MNEKLFRIYLVAFAIAIPIALIFSPQSSWARIVVLLIAMVAIYAPIFAKPDKMTYPWMNVGNNLMFGTLFLFQWLRELAKHQHDWIVPACGFILTYGFLFLILFGPTRFRREPQPKPSFSLLGNRPSEPSTQRSGK